MIYSPRNSDNAPLCLSYGLLQFFLKFLKIHGTLCKCMAKELKCSYILWFQCQRCVLVWTCQNTSIFKQVFQVLDTKTKHLNFFGSWYNRRYETRCWLGRSGSKVGELDDSVLFSRWDQYTGKLWDWWRYANLTYVAAILATASNSIILPLVERYGHVRVPGDHTSYEVLATVRLSACSSPLGEWWRLSSKQRIVGLFTYPCWNCIAARWYIVVCSPDTPPKVSRCWE